MHGSLKALHARDVDLVIGERYPDSSLAELGQGIDLEVMFEDPMVLLLPAERPMSIEPADLSGLAESPWVMDPPGVMAGRWQRAYCRSHGFDPIVLVETPDPFLQSHLVGAGHAVGLLYSLLATPLLGKVKVLPLPGRPHRTLFTAVHKARRNHPALRAVRQALADAAHDEAPLS
ncbi:LysR substrate-binding domain-containing protein [Corynebacterium halotolerans]|uniref:LysR substrate-binding domain-containing protein n=1 Tax=Corynebacterium halotolerans TaxID=225326 RepID=UPI003CF61193